MYMYYVVCIMTVHVCVVTDEVMVCMTVHVCVVCIIIIMTVANYMSVCVEAMGLCQ